LAKVVEDPPKLLYGAPRDEIASLKGDPPSAAREPFTPIPRLRGQRANTGDPRGQTKRFITRGPRDLALQAHLHAAVNALELVREVGRVARQEGVDLGL